MIDYELVGLEEHEDFERGAEDQELRAAREQADDELAREAYWEYCEGMESSMAPILGFRRWKERCESQRYVQPTLPVNLPRDENDSCPF